jgi:hypothetical protein
MNFTNVIALTMGSAPEGWAERLALKGFAELDGERKKYYEPLYAKYRTKKIRDYDPDYGNFVGWRPIQIGLGEPIGYRYVGYFAARMIDDVLRSNVLMARVLSPTKRTHL